MHHKLIAAVIVASFIAGGAGSLLAGRVFPTPSDPKVQVIGEALARLEATTGDLVRADAVGPLVSEYLVTHPRVLERASAALTAEIETQKLDRQRSLFADNETLIYSNEGAVVAGNPEGDVTLVEMYDYNCTYCKSMMPVIAELLASDPKLKLLLRQFPILSKGSVDAAKVGVLVAQAGADYWAFHQAMYLTRGQIDGEVALEEASVLGLDASALRSKMADRSTEAPLEQSYQIAEKLDITGTPTFLLGSEIVPGAVRLEVLQEKVANLRACGSTECPLVIAAP